MELEVVYAQPLGLSRVTLAVDEGITVGEVLQKIRQLPECAQWNVDPAAVGVFGQVKTTDYALMSNDRLEVYTPLVLDPKEARRLRAQNQRG